MDFEKLDDALRSLKVALIFSIADDDPEFISAPSDALISLMDEAEAMKKELKAIAKREAWYVESSQWDTMVPWFDMSPEEKVRAIEYWSE